MKFLTLKKAIAFAVLIILSGKGFSQATPLTAGDIAFTGINCTDNTINGGASNDDICFVLLKPINSGTTIYFTDLGWRSDAQAFQSANPCGLGPTNNGTGDLSSGVVKWVSTANMAYGSQIRIRCKVSPSANFGTATGEQATFNTSTYYVNITTAGESIFAYTGSLASPNLIAGINVNTAGWLTTLNNCDLNPTGSIKPPALSNSNCAFTLNFTGNVRLMTGFVLSSDPATARAQLANPANWEKDAANAYLLPAAITTLPIRFVSFSASPKGGGNLLQWEIAEETNETRYDIQRSEDGIHFTTIATINANSSHTYQYNDAFGKGTGYYRIRLSGNRGESLYSNIAAVNKAQSGPKLEVFPNPASDRIKVRNVAAGSTLQIFDNNGKLVHSQPGAGDVSIEVNNYPAGIYIIKIKGRKENASFIKQ